jgi:CMP-N-acetylneuraminic acid synthetase
MRVVGFVPSKLNSQRLPAKNIRPLGGLPLINWALATLNATSRIDEIVIYASDDEVMGHVDATLTCRFLERPANLDRDDATAEDFIAGFLAQEPCDVVVLLHATSPFIRPETVMRCLETVVEGRHQAAFAALALQRFCWYEERPLNYRLDEPTPRTQDLPPVLAEQSGLYVFTRELFEATRSRVSLDASIEVIDEIEGHDIDTPFDFKMAELLLQALELRPAQPTLP